MILIVNWKNKILVSNAQGAKPSKEYALISSNC